jgi:hypothetical protein
VGIARGILPRTGLDNAKNGPVHGGGRPRRLPPGPQNPVRQRLDSGDFWVSALSSRHRATRSCSFFGSSVNRDLPRRAPGQDLLPPYPSTTSATAWTALRLSAKHRRGQLGPSWGGRARLRPRELQREAAFARTLPRSSRPRWRLLPRRPQPRGHRRLRRMSSGRWRTSSKAYCCSDGSTSTRSTAIGFARLSQTCCAAETGGRPSSVACGHGGPPLPPNGTPGTLLAARTTPHLGSRLAARAEAPPAIGSAMMAIGRTTRRGGVSRLGSRGYLNSHHGVGLANAQGSQPTGKGLCKY